MSWVEFQFIGERLVYFEDDLEAVCEYQSNFKVTGISI